MIRESHSITPPDPSLDHWERLGLVLLGIGLALLTVASLQPNGPFSSTAIFWTMLLLVSTGGLIYSLRTHLKRHPGVQNNNLTRNSVTSRGAIGWLLAVVITALYTLLYWFHPQLEGLIRFFDPLSQLLRSGPADVWFMYGSFYTVAIGVMGAKAIAKYRHNRYQILRTLCIIFSQLVLAYVIPSWLERLNQPYFAPNYFWPLSYSNLFPSSVNYLTEKGGFAMFILGWGIIMSFVATPFLTYYYGKRWYCSWVCGCGGLANTAGDAWRQLSDKSVTAWKTERYSIYSVLVLITVTTGLLWYHSSTGAFGETATSLKKFYGFFIGSMFSGVIGVGFYPIMGTRVWCRFGCPQAAILGIIQRFKSRYRITTNGAQCISCGNCSNYCEMGIDVRWYAQRGQDIKRASCVGCGICSNVCPRGVLNLENGPTQNRKDFTSDLLGPIKSRTLENTLKK